MRNRFDKELQTLNNELIEMGSMIETAIEGAARALIKKDVLLAREVIVMDADINEKEREIERHCLKLLLQQQPVATDLRLISTALKMITDMERIGDQAADISEIVTRAAKEEYFREFPNISKMAEATIKMVKNSVDAFVNKDIELANSVIQDDDVVDNLFAIVKQALIESIRQHEDTGELTIDFLMIAKYFERIGDHAVNIAQWVVFSITGTHKNERIV